MAKFFISYRREDSMDITGRIYDRLLDSFGEGAVLINVDSIPIGVDFRHHLTRMVCECDVVLAVIGPHWLEATYQSGPNAGQRRIEDEADFVRIELAAALGRQIPVVPVLVGGAAMPPADRLPADLHELAFRNAAEVRSGHDFRGHVGRLIAALKLLEAKPPENRTGAANWQSPSGRTPWAEPRVSNASAPTAIAASPVVEWPTNLNFDGPVLDGVPYGWFNSVGCVGGASADYTIQVSPRDDGEPGKCAELWRVGSRPQEFGSLMQRCPAHSFIGKIVRVEAELQAKQLTGWAGLWLRIDSVDHHLFFDNMSDRPIRESTPWRRFAIVALVPPESEWLNYAILLVADGTSLRGQSDGINPRASMIAAPGIPGGHRLLSNKRKGA